VEHPVTRLERRAERDDQLRAVAQIPGRVGVLLLAPALGLRRVLRLQVLHRSASSRSGCLRRKRAMARRCQIVCRLRKVWSITAAYSWWTTASGTYQRSQPALAAR